MLLMGMDKASYRNSTGGGSKDIPLSSNGIPSKRSSVLPVLKTRTLVAPSNKHNFTQSFRDPATLTKKSHHGSGTFTLSMDHSAVRSGIPILTDKPKITHGPTANKSIGTGISRNRGQTVNLGSSRHKQLANVHEMHLHPKQRTGSVHHYSPGKFPSLPQISGESRIPLPQATPPSSHLPVLSHHGKSLPSPVGAKMSRLPPSVPRSTKFHRSESLRTESTQQSSTGTTSGDAPRIRRNAQGHRLPMTPQYAIKEFGYKITQYEKKEILEYPEIWFLGMESKKVEGVIGGAQNSGYDDDSGSYIKVLHDHIVYRYDIREVIGKGSFGQVVKCFDHKTNQPVAIKIIRNKKRFHHQALVEVKILDSLRKKDRDNQYNIIHMIDYFYFRNHLCITFELMGMNLYELIKKNNFQGFSIALIRRFAYALLQCLKLLVRERIIHCDLKPENILLRLRGQSQIKVIDFGSSCYDHQRVYTYIQSRFYRSPEVILGLPYTMAIDMWSFGAILAELYTGYPLFPGENEVEQLACIMEIFGPPSQSILSEAQRRKLFFDSKGNPRCITNSKGRKRRPGTKEFSSAVKSNDEHFLNFLSQCLDWDPAKRLTPDEALKHEWILEGRSRSIPRALPTPNSSTGQSTTHHSFQSHVNGESVTSSKHSTTTTTTAAAAAATTNFSSSKRRLQPIGGDAKQKAGEKSLLNGVYNSKRSSLVLESSSLDAMVVKQQSAPTAESSSSSLNSTTNQAGSTTDAPPSGGVAQVLTSKAVPQLV